MDFVSKEIASLPPQLSYSVNESLSEVAVRDSSAGAKGQKHAAKWLSVPQETPYESWKKQLFCYFFSASVKKVRGEINLDFVDEDKKRKAAFQQPFKIIQLN